MRNVLGGCALVLATLVATPPEPARAADGALEINQDCVGGGCFSGDSAGYPVQLTLPGRYLLTSNLVATGIGLTAIEIAASPVVLDLGGFTIDGGTTCIGYPVGSCAGSSSARGILVGGTNRIVTIRNGSIRGFGDGIVVAAALDGSVLEDLTISDNRSDGIAVTASASPTTLLVRRVASSRNFDDGISANAGRIVVRDSLFSGNGDGADMGSSRAVFLDNQFIFNFFIGVRCAGTGHLCVLGRNVFLDNNSSSSSNEFDIATLRDMGGNVCEDGACP